MNTQSKLAPKPLLCLSLASVLFAGCATGGGNARVIEQNKAITTVGTINVQDFANAADTMVNSLVDGVINAGKLEAPAGQPSMLAISRIVNNTSAHVDTDLLIKKIRVALNKTGKVVTTTTMGLGGKAEDPLAQGIKQQTEFLQDKKNTRLPDYSLSGKITEVREHAGNVRQSSFVFQLSLTSKEGVAVWEDEKTITKQGSRSTVGF
jgi:penicillin-binding protein activator